MRREQLAEGRVAVSGRRQDPGRELVITRRERVQDARVRVGMDRDALPVEVVQKECVLQGARRFHGKTFRLLGADTLL